MENDEITERLQRLQAHQIAVECAVRLLLLQAPTLSEQIRANAQDIAAFLLPHETVTDSQIAEVAQTLRLLAAAAVP